VLLVHGVYAGASSYEFRKLVPLLATQYRVVTFDLLGCGDSDKPDIAYNADLFAALVTDAAEKFGGDAVAVVASSLGAAFSLRAVARSLRTCRALVTICPTGLNGVLDGTNIGARSVAKLLLYAPIVGRLLYGALVTRPSIRFFLKRQAYGDDSEITPEIVDHYVAVSRQRGARFVPRAFVSGQLDCDVRDDIPRVEAPLLILWGARDTAENPISNAIAFAQLAKHPRTQIFGRSAYLPHEQEPQGVAAAIAEFLGAAAPATP
jgi:pimeloyl-ACP methyl ester carboxylesterase